MTFDIMATIILVAILVIAIVYIINKRKYNQARDYIYQYFTKDNNGRVAISNVGQEITEAELLKNIVKLKATKTMNGIRQILSSNKSIEQPDLTLEEFEYIMHSLLSNYDLVSVKYILNKYPHLFTSLANSFVNSRYTQQRYTKNDIDSNYKDDPRSVELLNKIDQFYSSIVQQNIITNAQKGN